MLFTNYLMYYFLSNAPHYLYEAFFLKINFSFVSEGSTFVKALALGSVILCGVIRSAPLPPLSPNLEDPKPVERKDENRKIFQNCVTISAGNTLFSLQILQRLFFTL